MTTGLTRTQTDLAPTPGSPRDRDNRFYELLVGGARTRILETMLDLGLFELLGAEGPMTAQALCERLALDPHRGWKFLHCAALAGLLEESDGERGATVATYALSPDARDFFGDDGRGGWFFRELVKFWRGVAVLPTVDVLRGMPLPHAVRWPPPDLAAAEYLEAWMRESASGAIRTVIDSGALAGAKSLLDVGGGDGTMACALVSEYPDLEACVFNLPASAYLARKTIAAAGLTERVTVQEGDFLADDLPGPFDRVMFSRVLTDWAPEVCVTVLDKARRALAPGGRVVLNEALLEGNRDYALSWEFRYIHYDTFGRAVFKSLSTYERLFAEAGLRICAVTPMTDAAFYSVVQAEPADD